MENDLQNPEPEWSFHSVMEFLTSLILNLLLFVASPKAWFKKMFPSATPATETTSKFRETYPHTQREEITFWDACLTAGILLFIALGFFLLQSVTCFHNSEACFLGSAKLGGLILSLVQ